MTDEQTTVIRDADLEAIREQQRRLNHFDLVKAAVTGLSACGKYDFMEVVRIAKKTADETMHVLNKRA